GRATLWVPPRACRSLRSSCVGISSLSNPCKVSRQRSKFVLIIAPQKPGHDRCLIGWLAQLLEARKQLLLGESGKRGNAVAAPSLQSVTGRTCLRQLRTIGRTRDRNPQAEHGRKGRNKLQSGCHFPHLRFRNANKWVTMSI